MDRRSFSIGRGRGARGGSRGRGSRGGTYNRGYGKAFVAENTDKFANAKVKAKYFKGNKKEVDNEQVKAFYDEIFAEVDKEKGFAQNKSKLEENQDEENMSDSEDKLEEVDRETRDELKQHSTQLDEKTIEDKDSVTNASSHKKKRERKAKPNPFKRSLQELEKQEAELDKIKKEAAEAKVAEEKKRKMRVKKRKEDRKLLTKKTKKGQANLNNHISHLLSKIQNEE